LLFQNCCSHHINFFYHQSPPNNKIVKPSLPADFEEKTWAKLSSSIEAIYTSKSVNDSLEELYKACENLCLHKLSKSLYQRLHSELEKHILLEGENIQRYVCVYANNNVGILWCLYNQSI